mmetsp:Transcript_92990/g.206883  ORF Transcript_92990/g.206883 Transcript_92990/m.206883 type:complete len:397 (+) Transcript_92990:355-1545(+)
MRQVPRATMARPALRAPPHHLSRPLASVRAQMGPELRATTPLLRRTARASSPMPWRAQQALHQGRRRSARRAPKLQTRTAIASSPKLWRATRREHVVVPHRLPRSPSAWQRTKGPQAQQPRAAPAQAVPRLRPLLASMPQPSGPPWRGVEAQAGAPRLPGALKAGRLAPQIAARPLLPQRRPLRDQVQRPPARRAQRARETIPAPLRPRGVWHHLWRVPPAAPRAVAGRGRFPVRGALPAPRRAQQEAAPPKSLRWRLRRERRAQRSCRRRPPLARRPGPRLALSTHPTRCHPLDRRRPGPGLMMRLRLPKSGMPRCSTMARLFQAPVRARPRARSLRTSAAIGVPRARRSRRAVAQVAQPLARVPKATAWMFPPPPPWMPRPAAGLAVGVPTVAA